MKYTIALLYITFTLLVGCSATSFETSHIVSTYTRQKISSKILAVKQDFQLHDTLGKKIALYSLYNKRVPLALQNKLNQIFNKQVTSYNLAKISVTPSKAKQILADSSWTTKANIYFTTLTDLAVSDKNLAIPIAKILDGTSLLVYSITMWPCENCSTKLQLYSKLQLVNIHYSSLLWTATSSKMLKTNTPQQVEMISQAMLRKMLYEFHLTFKKKWHKQRYRALLARGKK